MEIRMQKSQCVDGVICKTDLQIFKTETMKFKDCRAKEKQNELRLNEM